ncbi:MAG TPA: ABC transporter permease [Aggregatilinea sp.]|uniref:ABC transporter permease n=1 Tax=Aggregatilinea sp. TaxID=2806333 RepID=UPI002BA2DADA|nr:ABC transporter permease [Aggregatilinea sp.]HML20723.1 ABC transporter permease [Aggregatilinea sp.]
MAAVSSSKPHSGAKSNVLLSLLGQIARLREFFLILLIVLIGFVLHLKTGHFFTERNLTAIALGFSPLAFMAVGMTAALVSGGFDLSVGSVFALGGVVTAVALRDDMLFGALPIGLSMLMGIAAGVLAGFVNGLLITRAQINPFITTLGMMSIARGAGYAITEGSPIARLPKEFFTLGQGEFLGLSNLIWIALVVLIIGDILMRRSAMFRQIYYVGGNEDAARLSGINVDRVKLGVYTLSATLAALAGVLSVSRFTVADPGAGSGYELQVIAACIIGGASLNGGKGTVFGALLGLVFVGFINNGMVQLRVPVYWQNLAMGVILLLAVGSDTLSQRLRSRSRTRKGPETESKQE